MFNDIEEGTAVLEELHCNFFHEFVKIGSTVLFNKYVVPPTNVTAAEKHMHEMKETGLHGCMGLIDVMHIIHEQNSARFKQNYLGGKDSHTTHAFNITVNHRRHILSTT